MNEKFKGSVKVMRSYDYCHFEVCLSSDEEKTLEEINDMRKEAAKLTDKAVKQYAQFKNFHGWIADSRYEFRRLEKEIAEIKETPKSEWTPKQKAKIKLFDDILFCYEREYDYDNNWDDNYPEF